MGSALSPARGVTLADRGSEVLALPVDTATSCSRSTQVNESLRSARP